MSNSIPIAWEQEFSDNFIHLSQQKTSRLRGAVRVEDNINAKAFHFDRLDTIELQKAVSRHEDTPLTEVPFSRRRVTFDTFRGADLIDDPDRRKMAKDPTSPTMQAILNGYNRKIDDLIIAAATGNAFSIDEDDASTSVALPAGQTIAVNFASAGTGLTLEKVIETRRILWANEVDEDEDLFFIAGSTQMANMLNLTEVGSADYNSVRALVRGEIDTFMGFKWIRSERLSKSGTDRSCLGIARTGLGLAISQEKKTRMTERADKNYSMQVFLETTLGATRIEDEKVVEIPCTES